MNHPFTDLRHNIGICLHLISNLAKQKQHHKETLEAAMCSQPKTQKINKYQNTYHFNKQKKKAQATNNSCSTTSTTYLLTYPQVISFILTNEIRFINLTSLFQEQGVNHIYIQHNSSHHTTSQLAKPFLNFTLLMLHFIHQPKSHPRPKNQAKPVTTIRNFENPQILEHMNKFYNSILLKS